MSDVTKLVEGYELPEGYAFDIRGEVADTEKTFLGVGRNLGLVSLVLLAIFLQLRSVLQPLIILVAIPLSFIGAILMLWLTSQPLSFFVFIGLTTLTGIGINNCNLLVDAECQLRAHSPGEDLAEIAIRARTHRLCPSFYAHRFDLDHQHLWFVIADYWYFNVQRTRCFGYLRFDYIDLPDFVLCTAVVLLVDVKAESR